MIPEHILKNMDEWVKTICSLAELANDLESDPQHAIERVNAELNEASRQEENRQNILELEEI